MNDDKISRKAALRALEDCIKARLEWNSDSRGERQGLNAAMCVIEDLPSAQTNLQPTCNQLATDCISRQAAIDEFYMATCDVDKVEWAENVLKRVPTAERKGHWYKNSTLINCSVCKHCSWSVNAYEDLVKTFKYCPNCGARMESE